VLLTRSLGVPRYKMLLENLLKFTLESHPDYDNLKAAIEKMGALADLINVKLKEQKSQRRMAYIASRLPEESTEAVDVSHCDRVVNIALIIVVNRTYSPVDCRVHIYIVQSESPFWR